MVLIECRPVLDLLEVAFELAEPAGEVHPGLNALANRDEGHVFVHFQAVQRDILGAAVMFPKNVGMLLLAIWLILYGLAGMVALVLPSPLMAILALLARILILVGR